MPLSIASSNALAKLISCSVCSRQVSDSQHQQHQNTHLRSAALRSLAVQCELSAHEKESNYSKKIFQVMEK